MRQKLEHVASTMGSRTGQGRFPGDVCIGRGVLEQVGGRHSAQPKRRDPQADRDSRHCFTPSANRFGKGPSIDKMDKTSRRSTRCEALRRNHESAALGFRGLDRGFCGKQPGPFSPILSCQSWQNRFFFEFQFLPEEIAASSPSNVIDFRIFHPLDPRPYIADRVS